MWGTDLAILRCRGTKPRVCCRVGTPCAALCPTTSLPLNLSTLGPQPTSPCYRCPPLFFLSTSCILPASLFRRAPPARSPTADPRTVANGRPAQPPRGAIDPNGRPTAATRPTHSRPTREASRGLSPRACRATLPSRRPTLAQRSPWPSAPTDPPVTMVTVMWMARRRLRNFASATPS